MASLLDRALASRRPSRRVAFKESFDVASDAAWSDLIRDVVALANSGGGLILFGVDRKGAPIDRDLPTIDLDLIAERLQRHANSYFSDFEVVDVEKDGVTIAALIIGDAVSPIVLSGIVYVRHGAKSEPATTEDLAEAIDRRVENVRRSWFSAVKRVTQSPIGAAAPLLSSEIRDSESEEAVPIRIVDDPAAPAYRVVDYDKTHPFRQKEVLTALRRARPDSTINQFDLRAVRNMHDVDANPELSHKTMFGTRQYSAKFIDWLTAQFDADPEFFAKARAEYLKRIRRGPTAGV